MKEYNPKGNLGELYMRGRNCLSRHDFCGILEVIVPATLRAFRSAADQGGASFLNPPKSIFPIHIPTITISSCMWRQYE